MQWEETQDNFKLNMQRNVYGLHAPVRQLMERSIVSFVSVTVLHRGGASVAHALSMQNPHMPTYRTTNVHLDILMGRDETVEPADFMTSGA